MEPLDVQQFCLSEQTKEANKEHCPVSKVHESWGTKEENVLKEFEEERELGGGNIFEDAASTNQALVNTVSGEGIKIAEGVVHEPRTNTIKIHAESTVGHISVDKEGNEERHNFDPPVIRVGSPS